MSEPRPLRIVHVDTGRLMRGGQRQLLLLARGLRARGHEQLIVCPEDSPLEAAARAEEFATLPLPRRDLGHARGIRRLRRRLRQESCDVIHAHDGAGQTIAWLASLGTEAKRVAHRRVTCLPARKLDYRLKYRYTAHGVIAVSEFVKALAVGAGINPADIAVIPDGVELPDVLPSAEARARVREQWGLDAEHFAIGLLASSAPEKGQDTAESAMERVASMLPRARLVIAGPLPSRHPAPAPHAGTADQSIIRLGYQNDLDEFCAGLDLFLMPSRSEGLGSSALFAMARGVPVVATRVGGLPEIVAAGQNGWLIPSESPEALAGAIADAASDRSRLRQFGASGRAFARRFSPEEMIEKTQAFYGRVLDTLPVGGARAPGAGVNPSRGGTEPPFLSQ